MRRLLLVEDDPVDAALVTRALNGGWRVTVCSTLQAALDATPRGSWSAVITDLCLPDASGDARARIVEQLVSAVGSSVPVLALTGALYRGERLALLRAGAVWVGLKGRRGSEEDAVTGEEEAAVYATVAADQAEARQRALAVARAAGQAEGEVAGKAAVVGLVEGLRAELGTVQARIVDRLDERHLETSGELAELASHITRPPWWQRGLGLLTVGWRGLAPATQRRLLHSLGGAISAGAVTAPWWLRWLAPALLEMTSPAPEETPPLPPMLPVVREEVP